MPRRTQIKDFEKVEKAVDMDRVVKDKRSSKRANKQKGERRNRHYSKTLLKHLKDHLEVEAL